MNGTIIPVMVTTQPFQAEITCRAQSVTGRSMSVTISGASGTSVNELLKDVWASLHSNANVMFEPESELSSWFALPFILLSGIYVWFFGGFVAAFLLLILDFWGDDKFFWWMKLSAQIVIYAVGICCTISFFVLGGRAIIRKIRS